MVLLKKALILSTSLLIITSLLSGCAGTKTDYDFKENSLITITGIDGYGKLSHIYSVNPLIELYPEDIEKQLLVENFKSSFKTEYSVDIDESLSNGDVIDVSVTYNDEYASALKINPLNTEFSITVSGLTEPTEIDLSTIFEPQFFDISPLGKMNIQRIDYNYPQINVSSETTTNLANGMIVTIKAEYDTNRLAESGYVLKSETFDVEVSGLSELLTADNITEEEVSKFDEQVANTVNNSNLELQTRHITEIKDPSKVTPSSFFAAGVPYSFMYYLYTDPSAEKQEINVYYVENPIRRADGQYEHHMLRFLSTFENMEAFTAALKEKETEYEIAELK